MASFNKVIMIGNLTRDPELRTTPKGTAVCSFSLALNRHYKTESGEERDETTFVDIEAYGKQAELIAKYVPKGRPLMVEGRLKLDSWEKNGEKRSRLKVVTENFQFMGYKDDAGKSSDLPAVESGDYDGVSPQSRPVSPASSPKPAPTGDDVPF
jgi:single-strand DNA-binding protein